MKPPAIEIRQLVKSFEAGANALNGLDLSVPSGAVYGLIGRNGAGKTTAMRILAGILKPTSGDAEIMGTAMLTANAEDRARFAYVSQHQQLPGAQSISQLGHMLSAFYPRWDHSFLKKLCTHFSMDANSPIQHLSGGAQRKVAIILAFAARPSVLLLDEPAAGLDPVSRRELIDAIVELISDEQGCTIMLSTHLLEDLERVADTIGIIGSGKMICSRSLDDLKANIQRVQVVFDGTLRPGYHSLSPCALRTPRRTGIDRGGARRRRPSDHRTASTATIKSERVPIRIRRGLRPSGGAPRKPERNRGSEMNAIDQMLFRQIGRSASGLYRTLFAVWLLLGWAVMFFSNYIMLGIFLGFVGLICGSIFGGHPVTTGIEEFLMGLPPTRTQQYRARFIMGLLPLLILTPITSAMIHWHYPERFWGLFFSSGYADLYREPALGWYAVLCAAIPFLLYVSSFVYSAMFHQAARIGLGLAGALATALTILGVGLLIDSLFVPRPYHGLPALALSIFLIAAIIPLGLKTYAQKEAGTVIAAQSNQRMAIGPLFLGVFLITLGLFFFIFLRIA